MNILEQPILLALIAAIPSFVLGYLGYRRASRVDKVAEQSGVTTAHTGAVNQVIEGLNNLIDNLQQDNGILRKVLADLDAKLERVLAERDKLKRQIQALNKKYNIEADDDAKA